MIRGLARLVLEPLQRLKLLLKVLASLTLLVTSQLGNLLEAVQFFLLIQQGGKINFEKKRECGCYHLHLSFRGTRLAARSEHAAGALPLEDNAGVVQLPLSREGSEEVRQREAAGGRGKAGALGFFMEEL